MPRSAASTGFIRPRPTARRWNKPSSQVPTRSRRPFAIWPRNKGGQAMASEIRVPRLGWDMEQGVFLGWLKRDGEEVQAGEPIYTLEGDKSAQEIEALDTGILRIAPNGPHEGDTILVGTLLGHVESLSSSSALGV